MEQGIGRRRNVDLVRRSDDGRSESRRSVLKVGGSRGISSEIGWSAQGVAEGMRSIRAVSKKGLVEIRASAEDSYGSRFR